MHGTSAVIFALAGGGAFLANSYERPITCALVFVFGVVIIAGLEGAARVRDRCHRLRNLQLLHSGACFQLEPYLG